MLWQFFSGMDYYEHRLPCDATQIGRFRRDVGEEGLEQLLKATVDAAVAMKAVRRLGPEASQLVSMLKSFARLAKVFERVGKP